MSIHVFDMDETLIFNDEVKINDEIIPILRELCKTRDSNGNVEAIFLLTNNGNVDFVNIVVEHITDDIYKNENKRVFDYILTRYHPARKGEKENPTKSIADVEYMMHKINKSFDREKNKIFFYDDLKGHILESEIPNRNFIHVKRSGTDFSAVHDSLRENSKRGGSSNLKNSRRRSFRRRKYRTRKRGKK